VTPISAWALLSLQQQQEDVCHGFTPNNMLQKRKMAEISGHYLPHRPVVKYEKTTKIRPVYDASAKSVTGISFNECLHTGPNLLSNLFAFLIRFRSGEVGVTPDIEKAFQKNRVERCERSKYVAFLWFRNGVLITLRHCRVLFGVGPSPFLLNMITQYHLRKFIGYLIENRYHTKSP